MLKARLFERADQIDPIRWDGVGEDPFSRHALLAALEGSAQPDVQMSYAAFEDARGHWIACAPFARIPIDGGRLTHGLFRRSIGAIRRMDPSFLRTTLMICGTPLSVGNPPIRIAAGIGPLVAFRAASELLRELAEDAAAPWRAFKELPARWLDAAASLRQEGWALAPSEPNSILPLPWTHYADYIAALRHPYRARLRKAAAKLQEAGIVARVGPLADYDATDHRLYEAVVERAAIQLERLTPAFFSGLGRVLPASTALLRFVRCGQTVGWVAILLDRGCAYDLFHGIDYEANRTADLYFNQIAGTIRFAIDSGARALSLGQSTEIAKARFGGWPVPLWILLRHRTGMLQTTLRWATPLLFPEKAIPEHHVFRASPAREKEGLRCASSSS